MGDEEGNYPTVHLTADPMVSLIERITNAMDATFEKWAEERPRLKDIRSPRTFAEEAAGIQDMVLSDSVKRRKKTEAFDSGIAVTLWDGDSEESPTVDILDNGIGLQKEEFPNTILSLHRRNKIKKWYLMGRFGQGGSTALRFSDYSIILSRKFNDPKKLTFSILKLQDPAQDEKDGKYVYLVNSDDGLPLSIDIDSTSNMSFNTLVRHINYKIGKQSLLTLYGLLEYFLFDPIMPYQLVNQKAGPYRERFRTIYGSRDRLNRTPLLERKDEFVIPPSSTLDIGTIKVRYWLFIKGTNIDQKATFIDPENPVVVTYFGQSHSVYPRRFLDECNLPYLKKDLVVQVDCDLISDEGRRILFPSTRESTTKEGTNIIKRIIIETLSNNKELKRLNFERQEASLTEGFTKEKEELRRNLAEMINRILPGRIAVSGGVKGEGDKKLISAEFDKQEEEDNQIDEDQSVPMKDFPTFIKIMNTKDPIVFRPNQSTRIEVLTDAPNEFLEKNEAYFELAPESSKFVIIGHRQNDIHYGRIFLSLRLKDNVPIFSDFILILQLHTTTESNERKVLEDSRTAIVQPPKQKREDHGKVQTDAPDIEIVDRYHDHYVTNKWTEKEVAEVVSSPEKVVIYVSVENEWYLATLRKSKYSEVKKQYIKNRYVLLIAFFAYLQSDNINKLQSDMEKSSYEKIGQSELEIAARTVLTGLTSEKAFEDSSG